MQTRRPKNSLANQLQLIAKDTENIGLMDDHLEVIRYVETIFPSFNRAIVLGGAPVGCIWLVHGEYRGGKSAFSLGLVISFSELGHLVAYYDAEHAVSKKWYTQLGANPDSFLFSRPSTFEESVKSIDKLIENFKKAKAAEILPPDKCLLIVIDSINKLTPEGELKKFSKEGPKSFDKGLGRFRAGLIQAWLDRMVPIVASDDIALICIAQERKIAADNPWDPDFQVKGGQGILYDASVQARVTLGPKTWEDQGSKKVMVGQGHRIIIFKNKVGFPMENGMFYTANGKGDCPIGFDHARTAFMEWKNNRKSSGIIEQTGAWYHYGGSKFNGEAQFLNALRNNPDLLNDLCIDLNNKIVG